MTGATLARADGSYARVRDRFARVDVLVPHDRALVATQVAERHDLLVILEDRSGARSTIIASQLPTDKWHDHLADRTLADAKLDGVVHNADRVTLEGPSQRKGESIPE